MLIVLQHDDPRSLEPFFVKKYPADELITLTVSQQDDSSNGPSQQAQSFKKAVSSNSPFQAIDYFTSYTLCSLSTQFSFSLFCFHHPIKDDSGTLCLLCQGVYINFPT